MYQMVHLRLDKFKGSVNNFITRCFIGINWNQAGVSGVVLDLRPRFYSTVLTKDLPRSVKPFTDKSH